jgi:hypothetical protein
VGMEDDLEGLLVEVHYWFDILLEGVLEDGWVELED